MKINLNLFSVIMLPTLLVSVIVTFISTEYISRIVLQETKKERNVALELKVMSLYNIVLADYKILFYDLKESYDYKQYQENQQKSIIEQFKKETSNNDEIIAIMTPSKNYNFTKTKLDFNIIEKEISTNGNIVSIYYTEEYTYVIKRFKPWNWSIVYASNTKNLNNIIDSTTNTIIFIITILVFSIMLIVSLVYYLNIKKPFNDIFIYLEKVALGEYKYFKNQYVTKEINTLLSNINNMVESISKREELEKRTNKLELEQEKLKQLASLDHMTGLYNRRYFSEISMHIFDLSKRAKTPLSIVMIDIDKFKNVNDTYGHQIGDDVIIILSNILKELQRKSDIICRYGGEEFIVLLPNTTANNALLIIEKLRKIVEATPVPVDSNKDLHFTVSAGISQIIDDELNLDLVIKRADDALYTSKNNGRNKSTIQF